MMASTGSATATFTSTKEPSPSSQLLGSSISSLSNSTSSRHASSQIAKIYRQASTLFLTRRLPESLSTILPVITPPTSDENAGKESNERAPVATASRSTRIKVWSLYLTILNAILELDPDEGKQAFGAQEWRGLVTKVREGEVWEEAVKNGYSGVEGDVDPDVVINLTTILLTHARTQGLNQQRLENYLASSHNPTLDINARLEGIGSPRRRSPIKNHGTDTPRDLNTRIRILELFTLHVLRHNNEWDYAQEFITNSADLDDERREAFLQALQSLHDEYQESQRNTLETQRRKEEQLQQDMEEARKRRIENEERERNRELQERNRREGSENDYGIENTKPNGHTRSKSSKGSIKPPRSSTTPSSTMSPKPRPSKAVTPPTYTQRASAIIFNLRKLLENMTTSLQTNPIILFRALAFIIGILAVFGRRDVRERLRRLVGRGWGKVVQTAGMGVKVSYI